MSLFCFRASSLSRCSSSASLCLRLVSWSLRELRLDEKKDDDARSPETGDPTE